VGVSFWCADWFASAIEVWCLQRKRTSANLIVVIPLLIAIQKEEVNTQSAGQDVWQQHR